ncbi:MAG: DNA mismatch repair protein MutS, partial [Bdellovibrionaceae bacterium]|nr:DNA mismatch repair protein MutS [Pseudobdellovibrionaceae bacterium]
MQQYYDLKSEAGSALLFFRMGDFYELFDEDAKEASRILNITLTSRDKKSENPTPMAGIPHHALEGYLQKLLQAGKKVAIGEQLENPNETKGIVKRGIVRILTPAVQFNHEEEDSQYLVHIKKQNSKTYSFVALDPSTGESKVSPSLTEADLENQLQNQSIRHLLIEEENPEWISSIKNRTSLLIETLPSNYIHLKQAQKLLQDHYEMISLDSFIPEESIQLGLAKALLYTLKSQQIEKLPHLQLPTALESNDRLELGPQTARHLDLLPQPEGNPNLFQWMNHTGSALGSRYLKTLIQSPFKRCEDILIFQNAVREWSESPKRFEIGKKLFSKVYDLERILGRIHTGLANPRDTYALGQSLFILESLESILSDLETPLFLEVKTEIKELKADLHPLYQRILETQNDEAPLLARDGKIFKRGFSKELDHLIQLTENGEQWLIDLEKKERESTGISNLKVRYNRVFGYYIEVTKAHSSKVPERYQRKQTMVNAERFFTSELKKFEEEILSAESKRKSLELELFQELLEEIKAHSNSISTVAKLFGQIDTIQSLAHLSIRSGWTFPEIDQSLDLEIENGRHPLVDEALGGDYIPNSVTMQDQTALTWIITGPNMGGKSTLMRQVALIILLGQMGAPVPAKRARWGVFNSIFTRIGAHDAISKGQSTFMVETNELAHLIQRS